MSEALPICYINYSVKELPLGWTPGKFKLDDDQLKAFSIYKVCSPQTLALRKRTVPYYVDEDASAMVSPALYSRQTTMGKENQLDMDLELLKPLSETTQPRYASV